MELKQIKYFIEVAKREHVTEAADALHIAQSAVSRQLFKLEEELGVNLFIREGRNVRLTPIGKIFMEHMEKAVHVIDEAEQVIKEYTDPERGTVHIGFPSSLASNMLPTSISAFRDQHPNVKFKLKQGTYYELVEAVKKSEINMALLGPIPQNEPKLKGTILFSENMVALLPVRHPLANEPGIKLNQLRKDSFVLFREGFILRNVVVEACNQLGFQPRVSFEGEDIEAIKGLVSAGLGVTLIPEITLIDHLPHGTVKVPIINPNVSRTVGVMISAERSLLPTEKRFYEFLKSFYMRLEKFQI
ncbi:LysR family transcriptional regulator [Oceanobacillus sp. FSL K6-0127]|uniref:LysR family transcriptional regulator n=1 Tax=unclassified Oceanobacillus TaxID=2630292 RepID=UPI0030ECF599